MAEIAGIDLHFEKRVLRFISFIGIVRMLVELYSNYLRSTSLFGWTMDIILISIITSAFILSFTSLDFRYVMTVFSVIILGLLSLSWINTGGVYGRSESNYFGLILAVALLNSGSRQQWLLSLTLLTLLSLVVIWEYKFDWIEPMVINFNESPLHYISMVILCTVIVYYLKYLFDHERKSLRSRQLELAKRTLELDIENERLINQQKEFERVNERLESEIKERRLKLEEQNKSLREFIEVSLREFHPPLLNTLNAIQSLNNKSIQSESLEMLQRSARTLEQAYDSMKSKMRSNLK